ELFQVLVQSGKLVRVKDSLFFHAQALEAIQAKLVTMLRERKEIGPSDIKDLLGISRKYAIPLLEFFDERRVTPRVGETRMWAAVQFERARHESELLKQPCHPPGDILYGGLGRRGNVWLDDPTASYVVLAVAFSGLTTFVVYCLARAVYDRTTALPAAALLAVSPLFWFYGSVGLTYAGEALFASTVAYFGFRALNGSRSDAYLAAWY